MKSAVVEVWERIRGRDETGNEVSCHSGVQTLPSNSRSITRDPEIDSQIRWRDTSIARQKETSILNLGRSWCE